MYWRLLSSNPAAAKGVVMGEKPAITAESEKLDPITLEEMCLVVGTLATVYLKPVHTVFRSARPRRLQDSPALQRAKLPSYQAAQQAKLISSQDGKANGANGTPQNGDVLDEADAYFASVGSNSMAVSANGDFASSPTTAGPGTESQMYVVNQGQGLGQVNPTMHVQNGEGDLLSF